jgi:hypothetical protein
VSSIHMCAIESLRHQGHLRCWFCRFFLLSRTAAVQCPRTILSVALIIDIDRGVYTNRLWMPIHILVLISFTTYSLFLYGAHDIQGKHRS